MIRIGTHPADMTDKEIRENLDYIIKENPDVTEGTLDIVKIEDEDGETVELTLRGILSGYEDRVKHGTGGNTNEI